MTIFATKEFARFARKADLAAPDLLEAGRRVVAGQADASLGHGVFKQRVARQGRGKSGGFRTLVVFKVGQNCFFVHGFAKSDKANVSAKGLQGLKRLALVLLAFDDRQLATAIDIGELIEVKDDGDEKSI